MSGLAFAQAQPSSAHLDFDRIAKGSMANNGDFIAIKETELHQPLRKIGRAVDPIDPTAVPDTNLIKG